MSSDGSRRVKEKAAREVGDLLGFIGELAFGEDEPGETLARRVIERGDETSPAVKEAAARAMAIANAATAGRTGPGPAKPRDPPRIPERAPEPGPEECAGCRVAAKLGRGRCVEHS